MVVFYLATVEIQCWTPEVIPSKMTFGQTFKHLPVWKLPDAPILLTYTTPSSAKQPIMPF